jgi:hypothetical protein
LIHVTGSSAKRLKSGTAANSCWAARRRGLRIVEAIPNALDRSANVRKALVALLGNLSRPGSAGRVEPLLFRGNLFLEMNPLSPGPFQVVSRGDKARVGLKDLGCRFEGEIAGRPQQETPLRGLIDPSRDLLRLAELLRARDSRQSVKIRLDAGPAFTKRGDLLANRLAPLLELGQLLSQGARFFALTLKFGATRPCRRERLRAAAGLPDGLYARLEPPQSGVGA